MTRWVSFSPSRVLSLFLVISFLVIFLMDLLSGLNEPQRQAVLHENGPLLIFAGAGSGKTRTLTHRIAYLVNECGVFPSRILAVTFTNKAAREMRERLDHLIGTDANRLWLGTFHAMCAQMLRINGGLIGIDPRFNIFDSDDSQRVMKDTLREADIDSDRFPPARVLGRISDAKNNLLRPDDFAAQASTIYDKTIARLYTRYQEKLREAHALDFDDLIGEAVRLLKESPDALSYWSERFLHVMIDEFQDANAAQFQWAQLLASRHRNICVVGDDDQCLAAGTPILTSQGELPIEAIGGGDSIISGAGRGTTAQAIVRDAKARDYDGKMLRVTTRGGRELRLTPNHMCFARLGVRPDVHYVYLMYRRDKGFRIGITVGARSDGRRTELVNGLQVRVNQEHADKVWLLRVCPTRVEAAYYEQLYSFQYGIPTTVFHVCGPEGMHFSQAKIDRLFTAIDTRERAARLMDDLGLDASHPHYRPSSLGGSEMPHRMTVHLTCFGSNVPSIASPWFRHRVWLNTSDRVLESQLQKSGIATRPGQRETWRVERSYAEMDRTALLAEQIASAAGGLDVARWAALTEGAKFAFTPASHLRSTMIVPAWQDGRIVDDEILSVEEEHYNGTVHDLNVSHLRNYVAGGIVVHNSIYAWRGANVRLILEFELSYPDAQIVRLEQNYRSTQNILDAAHGVISKNAGRAPKRLWTEEGGGAQLHLHGAINAQEESLWVVRKIQELMRQGRSATEFAILCRVNAQSRPFEEAFIRARVPLRLVGTQRFYERREIKDLIAYLKALHNPNDSMALARIINVPARGIGATTVDRLQGFAAENRISLHDALRDPGITERLGRAPSQKVESLRRLMDVLEEDAKRETSVAELLSVIVDRLDYNEFLRRDKTLDSIDRVANVQEFLSAAALFDDRMKQEPEPLDEHDVNPRGEPPHLGAFLETVALDNPDTARSDEAATLMTLHSAKGLEFPFVFLVGAEQGLLPHSRALWGEGNNEAELEEERRLCYVGLTRAREQVFLTYAAQRTLHGRTESTQPSQFLDEIPDALLQRSGLASSSGGSVYDYATSWGGGGVGLNARQNGTAKKAVEPPTFQIGDKLKHPTFGEGMVVAASGVGGPGEWVEVAFLASGAGKKKLIVAYAPLEKAE